MSDSQILQSVPITILTGLGAYGGFPQPPNWWKRLTNFKIMNFLLVWLLVFQGGGGNLVLPQLSLIIFIIMDLVNLLKVIVV